MELTLEDKAKVHNAIHDSKLHVVIQSKTLPVLKINGLRMVRISERESFWEQNPRKAGSWASKAREGQKITWLIRDSGNWGCIVDNGKVVKP